MSSDSLSREQRQILKQLFQEHIEKSGMNMTDLATILDVSRTTMHSWVMGRSSPKKSSREEIARKIFGISPIELEVKLFGGEVENEKSHEEILTAIRLAPLEFFLEIREVVFQRESDELSRVPSLDEDDFDV